MGFSDPPSPEDISRMLIKAARDKKGPNASAVELFSLLTECANVKESQVLRFFEAILRRYIDDDEDLEFILAMTGILGGYRSLKNATARREKYYQYINGIESEKKKHKLAGNDPDSYRYATEQILKRVASQFETELREENFST